MVVLEAVVLGMHRLVSTASNITADETDPWIASLSAGLTLHNGSIGFQLPLLKRLSKAATHETGGGEKAGALVMAARTKTLAERRCRGAAGDVRLEAVCAERAGGNVVEGCGHRLR